MKHANCALVAVACISAAFAPAQSQVTVYGVADGGVVSERGCVTGCDSETKVSSGIATTSHIGVGGKEALTDRLDAVFAIEAGFMLDTGRAEDEGKLFNQQSYVGLAGDFGLLTLGRHYSLDYTTLVDVGDPFHGGMSGSATNLVGFSGKRTDDSIRYEKRNRHGLFTAATYGFGERRRGSKGNRHWGVSVGLDRGPLVIRAAYQKRNVTNTSIAMPMGNSYDSRHGLIAANLSVGRAIAYTAYGISRGYGNATLWNPENPFSAAITTTPSNDSRDVLFGLALPDGQTTWLASYIRKNDRDVANNDANQLAFGASYRLSRRTDFYAAISRIHNKRSATYTVGNASDLGKGNKAINVGMRHAF